jgi:hypothetical protein
MFAFQGKVERPEGDFDGLIRHRLRLTNGHAVPIVGGGKTKKKKKKKPATATAKKPAKKQQEYTRETEVESLRKAITEYVSVLLDNRRKLANSKETWKKRRRNEDVPQNEWTIVDFRKDLMQLTWKSIGGRYKPWRKLKTNEDSTSKDWVVHLADGTTKVLRQDRAQHILGVTEEKSFTQAKNLAESGHDDTMWATERDRALDAVFNRFNPTKWIGESDDALQAANTKKDEQKHEKRREVANKRHIEFTEDADANAALTPSLQWIWSKVQANVALAAQFNAMLNDKNVKFVKSNAAADAANDDDVGAKYDFYPAELDATRYQKHVLESRGRELTEGERLDLKETPGPWAGKLPANSKWRTRASFPKQGDPEFRAFVQDVLRSENLVCGDEAERRDFKVRCTEGTVHARFAYQQVIRYCLRPGTPFQRALANARTGSGKTRMFIDVISSYHMTGRPILMLFPRQDLLKNALEELLSPSYDTVLRQFVVPQLRALVERLQAFRNDQLEHNNDARLSKVRPCDAQPLAATAVRKVARDVEKAAEEAEDDVDDDGGGARAAKGVVVEKVVRQQRALMYKAMQKAVTLRDNAKVDVMREIIAVCKLMATAKEDNGGAEDGGSQVCPGCNGKQWKLRADGPDVVLKYIMCPVCLRISPTLFRTVQDIFAMTGFMEKANTVGTDGREFLAAPIRFLTYSELAASISSGGIFNFPQPSTFNRVADARRTLYAPGMRFGGKTGTKKHKRPFDNMIVVMDEAHNLFEQVHQGDPAAVQAWEHLQRARGSRQFLFTATPVVADTVAQYDATLKLLDRVLQAGQHAADRSSYIFTYNPTPEWDTVSAKAQLMGTGAAVKWEQAVWQFTYPEVWTAGHMLGKVVRVQLRDTVPWKGVDGFHGKKADEVHKSDTPLTPDTALLTYSPTVIAHGGDDDAVKAAKTAMREFNQVHDFVMRWSVQQHRPAYVLRMYNKTFQTALADSGYWSYLMQAGALKIQNPYPLLKEWYTASCVNTTGRPVSRDQVNAQCKAIMDAVVQEQLVPLCVAPQANMAVSQMQRLADARTMAARAPKLLALMVELFNNPEQKSLVVCRSYCHFSTPHPRSANTAAADTSGGEFGGGARKRAKKRVVKTSGRRCNSCRAIINAMDPHFQRKLLTSIRQYDDLRHTDPTKYAPLLTLLDADGKPMPEVAEGGTDNSDYVQPHEYTYATDLLRAGAATFSFASYFAPVPGMLVYQQTETSPYHVLLEYLKEFVETAWAGMGGVGDELQALLREQLTDAGQQPVKSVEGRIDLEDADLVETVVALVMEVVENPTDEHFAALTKKLGAKPKKKAKKAKMAPPQQQLEGGVNSALHTFMLNAQFDEFWHTAKNPFMLKRNITLQNGVLERMAEEYRDESIVKEGWYAWIEALFAKYEIEFVDFETSTYELWQHHPNNPNKPNNPHRPNNPNTQRVVDLSGDGQNNDSDDDDDDDDDDDGNDDDDDDGSGSTDDDDDDDKGYNPGPDVTVAAQGQPNAKPAPKATTAPQAKLVTVTTSIPVPEDENLLAGAVNHLETQAKPLYDAVLEPGKKRPTFTDDEVRTLLNSVATYLIQKHAMDETHANNHCTLGQIVYKWAAEFKHQEPTLSKTMTTRVENNMDRTYTALIKPSMELSTQCLHRLVKAVLAAKVKAVLAAKVKSTADAKAKAKAKAKSEANHKAKDKAAAKAAAKAAEAHSDAAAFNAVFDFAFTRMYTTTHADVPHAKLLFKDPLNRLGLTQTGDKAGKPAEEDSVVAAAADDADDQGYEWYVENAQNELAPALTEQHKQWIDSDKPSKNDPRKLWKSRTVIFRDWAEVKLHAMQKEATTAGDDAASAIDSGDAAIDSVLKQKSFNVMLDIFVARAHEYKNLVMLEQIEYNAANQTHKDLVVVLCDPVHKTLARIARNADAVATQKAFYAAVQTALAAVTGKKTSTKKPSARCTSMWECIARMVANDLCTDDADTEILECKDNFYARVDEKLRDIAGVAGRADLGESFLKAAMLECAVEWMRDTLKAMHFPPKTIPEQAAQVLRERAAAAFDGAPKENDMWSLETAARAFYLPFHALRAAADADGLLAAAQTQVSDTMPDDFDMSTFHVTPATRFKKELEIQAALVDRKQANDLAAGLKLEEEYNAKRDELRGAAEKVHRALIQLAKRTEPWGDAQTFEGVDAARDAAQKAFYAVDMDAAKSAGGRLRVFVQNTLVALRRYHTSILSERVKQATVYGKVLENPNLTGYAKQMYDNSRASRRSAAAPGSNGAQDPRAAIVARYNELLREERQATADGAADAIADGAADAIAAAAVDGMEIGVQDMGEMVEIAKQLYGKLFVIVGIALKRVRVTTDDEFEEFKEFPEDGGEGEKNANGDGPDYTNAGGDADNNNKDGDWRLGMEGGAKPKIVTDPLDAAAAAAKKPKHKTATKKRRRFMVRSARQEYNASKLLENVNKRIQWTKLDNFKTFSAVMQRDMLRIMEGNAGKWFKQVDLRDKNAGFVQTGDEEGVDVMHAVTTRLKGDVLEKAMKTLMEKTHKSIMQYVRDFMVGDAGDERAKAARVKKLFNDFVSHNNINTDIASMRANGQESHVRIDRNTRAAYKDFLDARRVRVAGLHNRLRAEQSGLAGGGVPAEQTYENNPHVPRVMVITESQMEGISFFGVRKIVLVSPPRTNSEYDQAVGRVMRACNSHFKPELGEGNANVEVVVLQTSLAHPDHLHATGAHVRTHHAKPWAQEMHEILEATMADRAQADAEQDGFSAPAGPFLPTKTADDDYMERLQLLREVLMDRNHTSIVEQSVDFDPGTNTSWYSGAACGKPANYIYAARDAANFENAGDAQHPVQWAPQLDDAAQQRVDTIVETDFSVISPSAWQWEQIKYAYNQLAGLFAKRKDHTGKWVHMHLRSYEDAARDGLATKDGELTHHGQEELAQRLLPATKEANWDLLEGPLRDALHARAAYDALADADADADADGGAEEKESAFQSLYDAALHALRHYKKMYRYHMLRRFCVLKTHNLTRELKTREKQRERAGLAPSKQTKDLMKTLNDNAENGLDVDVYDLQTTGDDEEDEEDEEEDEEDEGGAVVEVDGEDGGGAVVEVVEEDGGGGGVEVEEEDEGEVVVVEDEEEDDSVPSGSLQGGTLSLSVLDELTQGDAAFDSAWIDEQIRLEKAKQAKHGNSTGPRKPPVKNNLQDIVGSILESVRYKERDNDAGPGNQESGLIVTLTTDRLRDLQTTLEDVRKKAGAPTPVNGGAGAKQLHEMYRKTLREIEEYLPGAFARVQYTQLEHTLEQLLMRREALKQPKTAQDVETLLDNVLKWIDSLNTLPSNKTRKKQPVLVAAMDALLALPLDTPTVGNLRTLFSEVFTSSSIIAEAKAAAKQKTQAVLDELADLEQKDKMHRTDAAAAMVEAELVVVLAGLEVLRKTKVFSYTQTVAFPLVRDDQVQELDRQVDLLNALMRGYGETLAEREGGDVNTDRYADYGKWPMQALSFRTPPNAVQLIELMPTPEDVEVERYDGDGVGDGDGDGDGDPKKKKKLANEKVQPLPPGVLEGDLDNIEDILNQPDRLIHAEEEAQNQRKRRDQNKQVVRDILGDGQNPQIPGADVAVALNFKRTHGTDDAKNEASDLRFWAEYEPEKFISSTKWKRAVWPLVEAWAAKRTNKRDLKGKFKNNIGRDAMLVWLHEVLLGNETSDALTELLKTSNALKERLQAKWTMEDGRHVYGKQAVTNVLNVVDAEYVTGETGQSIQDLVAAANKTLDSKAEKAAQAANKVARAKDRAARKKKKEAEEAAKKDARVTKTAARNEKKAATEAAKQEAEKRFQQRLKQIEPTIRARWDKITDLKKKNAAQKRAVRAFEKALTKATGNPDGHVPTAESDMERFARSGQIDIDGKIIIAEEDFTTNWHTKQNTANGDNKPEPVDRENAKAWLQKHLVAMQVKLDKAMKTHKKAAGGAAVAAAAAASSGTTHDDDIVAGGLRGTAGADSVPDSFDARSTAQAMARAQRQLRALRARQNE